MKQKLLMKINILGMEYPIYLRSRKDDKMLEKMDGYCAYENKFVVIDKDMPRVHQMHVLKHEIVHCFLYESGLDAECSWATNETVGDWIALQLFKMANSSLDAINTMKKFYKEEDKNNGRNSKKNV